MDLGLSATRFVRYLTENKFSYFDHVFWKISHVTSEDMEISEIALRIEWKHFRKPAGCFLSKSPSESRNLSFGHHVTFFQSSGKFEKDIEKKLLAWQSKLFLGGWKRFGVNRWSDGRDMSGKRPSPTRKVRVCLIFLDEYPIFDLAIF